MREKEELTGFLSSQLFCDRNVVSSCLVIIFLQGCVSLLGGVLGFGAPGMDAWYNLCFVVAGLVAIYIGHSAKQAGRFNKCLATLLGIFSTGLFIIALWVGLWTALLSGVCNVVDDALEKGTCSGEGYSAGGGCSQLNDQKTSCQLTADCEWNSKGEHDVCGISALTYIVAILDMLAALVCLIFGYAACCCAKESNQVAVTGQPQVVMVVQQQPVQAQVVGQQVVQAAPVATVVVDPKQQQQQAVIVAQ